MEIKLLNNKIILIKDTPLKTKDIIYYTVDSFTKREEFGYLKGVKLKLYTKQAKKFKFIFNKEYFHNANSSDYDLNGPVAEKKNQSLRRKIIKIFKELKLTLS